MGQKKKREGGGEEEETDADSPGVKAASSSRSGVLSPGMTFSELFFKKE